MAHPDCEVNKEAHFLNDQVLEWRIFDAVQPLFASPHLKWTIAFGDDTAASTVQGGAAAIAYGSDRAAEIIRSENAFDEFQIEMRRLPDTTPEKDLACEVFDDCRDNLSNLLDLFESLVQKTAIQASRTLPGEREGMAAAEMKTTTDEPPIPKTPIKSTFYDVNSWIGSFKQSLFLFTEPEIEPPAGTKSPISPTTSKGNSPTSTKRPKTYPRLQALGNIVQRALEDGLDIVESCAIYITLEQNAQDYIDGWDTVRSLNICMESPQVSGMSKLPDLSYPLDIPKTRWKDTGPSDTSRRLFRIMCNKAAGSSCREGLKQHHLAMLRLNGFQLEDDPLAFDMFFVPCRPPEFWQQIQLRPKNAPNFGPRPRYVPDLCSDIAFSRQQQDSEPTILSILFDEKKLFATNVDLLSHSGAWPAMSLADLLRSDFVHEPRAGGAFNPGDKAVLALSLARCLLHLHQDPWMDEPWTAQSVQFLHKGTTFEILDIHHPYVAYPLDRLKDIRKPMDLDLDKYRRVMMSFARLLLEIDFGRVIKVDISPSSNLDSVRSALSDLLESGNRHGEPIVHYYQAIKGCLNFKASLASLRKREPKAKLDCLIRKVLYTNVIQHLEKNLSIIPHHSRFLARRSLRMDKRLIRPAPVDSHPKAPASPKKRTPSRESLIEKLTLNRSGTFGLSQSDPIGAIGLHSEPPLLMFDGETSQNSEHINQADWFLSDLDAFYLRYIQPKVKKLNNSRPRIRIAVIDTGIDQNDSFLEPLIDDISEKRWEIHKMEVREERKKGNPLRMRRKTEFSPIRGVESFVNPQDSGMDTCGHGTHMAGLLLRVAPDVDIYVAKIACDIRFEDTEPVVKAIEWAIAQQVDIISMSFGIPNRRPEIATAIDKAAHQIMFAAASNGGKNRPRTYPATDPKVIGIHAMSGNGEGGSINPATEHEHDRLGTLGLGIRVRWKDKIEYKNGTSYATPIAAAMAANWLQWLNAVSEDKSCDVTNVQRDNWSSQYGIRTIFSRAMSQKHQELYYVAPWHLWKHDKDLSDGDIIGAIRGKDGL